jgi:hypothetical protein
MILSFSGVLLRFVLSQATSLEGAAINGLSHRHPYGAICVPGYPIGWKWALSLSSAERASRFADIVKANRR